MAPFVKRTGVVERIKELGLQPYVVHGVNEVSDKEKQPHIDAIVVESLAVVCRFSPSGVPVMSELT